MKLFETIKKQGGLNLLKQYIAGNAVFVVAAELLLLGRDKTSLEIIRLSAQQKIKKKLEKKYTKTLISIENYYGSLNLKHKSSNKVWCCWLQGIENAPEMVKCCYNSLKNNLKSKDIVLLTENNLEDYIELPDYIYEKWKKGIISHTHLTDIIRLELLLKYGGTWIDATVFCDTDESNISSYFFDSDLFLFQALKPGKDGTALFISSWYLSAKTNNKILWIARELLYEYWKTHNYMIDYFLLHHFVCIALEHNKEEWDKIMPFDNSTPHILLLRLFDKYDQELYDNIIRQCPFHKLSYKFDDDQSNKKNTYYKKILRRYGNE